MNTRQSAILEHLGLYRLTFRITLEGLGLSFYNTGNDLRRLTKAGLIEKVERAFGRFSYYHLTPAGAQEAHVAPRVGLAPGSQGLLNRLGMLWCCCMGETRRTRISEKQLQGLLGDKHKPRGQGQHCAQNSPEARCIYRVYVPGPETKVDTMVRAIESYYEKAASSEVLRSWMKEGAYRKLILIDEASPGGQSVAMSLREALKDVLPDAVCQWRVEHAPSFHTVEAALTDVQRELRGRSA